MTEPQTGPAQVRCTDMEDYARIFNEGFDEAARQREADVRTAGVRALKEAAAEQRHLAEDARTNNGHAEHEDIADWLEERADAIPGRTLHCPVGCDDGACETCPCCSAGFCVYGLDGLPEDPEDVGRWVEVAAEHNPVAALLKAKAWPAMTVSQIVADFVAQREEYVRVLRQCVDADADYHRWQGHAEARRQLADKLKAAEGASLKGGQP